MTIRQTDFTLPGQTAFYRGKVRDVYTIDDQYLVMVASDRISAFDVVLPRAIPYKGQVLNQIAAYFLQATKPLVPNWVLSHPNPRVTIGLRADALRVEMVIRAYLTGHAWREYKAGSRILCGVPLPEGLKEHDPFPRPIITPATKADEGHDEDISRQEILERGIVAPAVYAQMEAFTHTLFAEGSRMARERGLLLVDTKYEFGLAADGSVVLIDEIHTPDSSRYFYLEGYEDRQHRGEPQKQLSKEFVREWLIAGGFQGKAGQLIPEMTDAFVDSVTQRYVELYEHITGQRFEPAATTSDPLADMEADIVQALKRLGYP
ncbi:MAG: phosphoribosylaminoimidazolesuccinocarboxamide synthase [Bacteroidetes bacterium]|nr:phosphoribosylaminoimidazolesuccinocarboxamide synthase [Bacteroidota bacterium]